MRVIREAACAVRGAGIRGESLDPARGCATGAAQRALAGHEHWVCAVAFAPDGKRLISASEDQTVRLWEVAGWKRLAARWGEVGWILGVAFAPDGKAVAVAGGDGTIKVWDTTALRAWQAPLAKGRGP